jgi:hypothetical protein
LARPLLSLPLLPLLRQHLSLPSAQSDQPRRLHQWLRLHPSDLLGQSARWLLSRRSLPLVQRVQLRRLRRCFRLHPSDLRDQLLRWGLLLRWDQLFPWLLPRRRVQWLQLPPLRQRHRLHPSGLLGQLVPRLPPHRPDLWDLSLQLLLLVLLLRQRLSLQLLLLVLLLRQRLPLPSAQ